MMKNKFCVFILSHQNVNECKTLEMLKKYNYTGDWKIVIDDLDDQKEKYKERYKDHLVIFDKLAYLNSFDTAFSPKWDAMASPTYARMFLQDYVDKNKIENYCIMDDDIRRLNLVQPQKGKLKKKEFENIDEILDNIVNYIDSTKIYCLGFSSPMTYIGGKYDVDKILNKRRVSNIFILNSNRNLIWKTIFYEDCNTCLTNGNLGKLILSLPFVEIIADAQGSTNQNNNKKIAEGGMGELYELSNQYQRSFYSIMVQPSSVVLKCFHNKTNLYPNIRSNNQFPKIISDKFKKRVKNGKR